MNPYLAKLQPYPFEKLAGLFRGVQAPTEKRKISLALGEPQQATPGFIGEALTARRETLAKYPTTRGLPELRQAIAQWLSQRFDLPAEVIDYERQVLPVNGTREALFSFAQSVIDASAGATVVIPNPFYQIYEGAALLAGAEPFYVNSGRDHGYLPDFESVPASVWKRCQLLYICSPGNPTGSVYDRALLARLIELAECYDFIIAADECYSELYFDEDAPPPGLLQVAHALGNEQFRRCVVFHSLSKRSSAPGLRSGFVAGDAEILHEYFRYRTYHGCAMALPTQYASVCAWRDESHVRAARAEYAARLRAMVAILRGALDIRMPEGAFYLWLPTPIADTAFARRLCEEENVAVLPGSYLSRKWEGIDPGCDHVRIAAVEALDACSDAARRIRRLALSL